jgi:hypothetical protein
MFLSHTVVAEYRLFLVGIFFCVEKWLMNHREKIEMCDHGTGEMAVLNPLKGYMNYKFRGKTSHYIAVGELCCLVVQW